MRVLIVDDNELFAAALQRFLERRVDAIVVVGRGEDALAAIEASAFDLILCDVMLPGLQGAELADAIAARRPGARDRLVFMSGEPTSLEALAVGAWRVIAKPCDPPMLLDLLREARAKPA